MIQFLTPDALSGILTAPKNTGINPLFRGRIRTAANDEPRACYIKPQPDLIRCPASGQLVPNREIANEAIGYTLAKSCKLSVPETAGVILLEPDRIPEPTLTTLNNMAPAQDSYLCWFSVDTQYPNLSEKHLAGNDEVLRERQLKRLAKMLAENPGTAAIIAFDDWLHNTDRHLGNLLSGPGGQPCLIDHGRILNYPNWTPGQLGNSGPGIPAENRLRRLMDDLADRWSEKLPNKSAGLLAYRSFLTCFKSHGEGALRQTLSELFEPDEIDSIMTLLHTTDSPTEYAKASGMLC